MAAPELYEALGPRPADVHDFRAIYESSFPEPERGPVASVLDDLAAGRRRFFGARMEDRLVALGVVRDLGDRIALLEYFAVGTAYRSRGIGTWLLDRIRARLGLENCRGILLEAGSDERTGEEQAARLRTNAFYARAGASEVECAPLYRAPNFVATGSVAMRLMWISVSNAAPPTGPLLRSAISAIMVRSYGMDPGASIVQANLAALRC